jgi:hypothetical protein
MSADDPFMPEIRRARFERLTIYEVSDGELDTLERGSPDALYLNIAIALLSVAVSLTVTLATTSGLDAKLYTFFAVCTVVGWVGGTILLLLWRRSRGKVVHCAQVIRNRLPPDGLAKPLATLNTTGSEQLPPPGA